MEKESLNMNKQERNIYDRRRCAYLLGYNAEKNPPYIKRLPSYLCILVTVLQCLPEAAPSDIVLAQIFYIGCLCDQLRNLLLNSKLLVRFKVPAHQLILHPGQHL